MKIKDLVANKELNLKTRVTKSGERFNVALQLDLSKDELLSLGLSEPKGRGIVQPEPTLKELMLQGFANIDKQFTDVRKDIAQLDTRLQAVEQDVKLIKSTPTIKREIKNSKTKER